MRTRVFPAVTVSLGLLLAACGSSGGPSSSPTTQSASTTTVHVAIKAGVDPSVSAKMICEPEAQKAIYESATGVKPLAISKPTWVDHVYSCVYEYPGGASMRLSVKEFSTPAETTAYFDALATQLHKTKDEAGLGQGAFQVADGSAVVRKDYKVLLIDVTKLPAKFGVPADTRGNVAINVGVTLLGCWTGA